MEDGIYVGDCVCGGRDLLAHENRPDLGVEVDRKIVGVHQDDCRYEW